MPIQFRHTHLLDEFVGVRDALPQVLRQVGGAASAGLLAALLAHRRARREHVVGELRGALPADIARSVVTLTGRGRETEEDSTAV